MPKRRINSRQKGAAAERELAGIFREYFPGVVRGQQRSGLEQADVVGVPGWRVEGKRRQAFSVYATLEKLLAELERGERPLVCARRDRGDWLAVVRLADLLPLLRAEWQARLDQMLE